jgi:hypothetical protein
MTFDEALKIYKKYQEHAEIHDKLMCIFCILPQSFLPYPLVVIEEALNVIAEERFNEGDNKSVDVINSAIAFLISYKEDDEALDRMTKTLATLEKNPELKKAKLDGLERSRKSWLEFKDRVV